ncbi:Hypothetical protein R9X50_00378600 [Acrodontium crateriforme]|uniref:Uncharacterized protein n=1 Tax=Acrodontium crateriforme TaxID=150365 RepID=A0AAQ3M4T9_9PEZI|nr:Hypothetical protein R9X50_00378600 [Acrodontium crateriforme]
MSRQPQPPGQPPVSFRTVPGRNRTQKWNQAKTYNYDGDDWGGYDPYEEYGAPADGQSLPSQAGQSSSAQNPRSNRANSFDLGEERRAFSAGQPATYEEDRNGSMLVSSQRLNEYGRPRDFTNPEQVPRPLNTQVSPNRAGPASSTGVDTTQQTDSSVPAVTEKPLPFIRPSDIYKRMNEEKERERQSLDSSRPSIDSVQRGDSSSPPLRQISGNESDSAAMLLRMKPSLEPVVEQRETLIESVQSSQPFESNGAQYSARKLPGSSESQQKVSSNTPPTSLQPAEETVQTLRPVPPPVSRFSGLGTVDGYTGVESSGSREPLGTAETTASKVPGAPVEAQSGLSLSDNGQSNNGAAAGLQHQPSMGYKSVVNTAFDRSDDISVPPTPSSRNEPQAIDSSGMVRSDTTSTAGISPIMSRVPSAATAQQRVHERELHIPPVIEEPYKSYTPALLASTTYQTPLSTTTGHSKNASNELPANVQPGYRRSLDPPSNGSSPARTPGLEDTSSRRLSTPMAAETIDTTERTDVIDQTADVTNAYSKPTDARMTEHEESRQEAVDEYAKALPIGRGRSGTNYSLREADLARTINASPEDVSYSAAVAEAERATREQFLREHASNPGTPSSASFGPKSPGAYPAGLGIVRTSTPNSAKGRVKEIADKYHEIHEAARRDSQTSVVSTKSSWSNFRGSEENLLSPVAGRTLRRTNTGSQLALSTSPEQEHDEAVFDSPDKMFPEYDNSGDRAAQGDDAPHDHTRSENQQTFRPSMPGGWISAAPTPSDEKSQEIELHTAHSHYNGGSGEPATPRASHMQGDEEAGEGIDLTPTTKKEPLRTSNDINFVTPSSEISNLGPEASSSSAVPDFSANQYTASGVKNIHAEQARDAGAALGANLMSNAGLTSQSRDFAVRDSAPVQQPEMDPHPAIGDVYGISKLHIPPPLERGDSFATEGTASTASLSPQKEILDDGQENRKPGDVYFPNSSSLEPLAPLAFRKGSRLDGAADEIATAPERHPMMKSAFSADSINVCDNNGDSESDRLRREIVRSLDPIRSHDSHQQENSAHVEGNENNGTSRDVALSTEEPSHTLNQRFSWERPYEPPGPISAASTVPVPRIAEPEQGPEAASEMPHEHPRSHDLHVVNTGNFDSLASPVDQQSFKDKALPPLVPPISRSVSPLNDSQNALTPGGTKQRQDGMTEMAPSPISERHGSDADSVSHRLPSYYFSGSDVLGLGAVGAVGAAATTAAVDGDSKSARDTEAVSSNGGITENPLPAIPSTTGKDASSPRATVSHAGPESPRIPPFREILAVKSAPQRIEAYITTRQTFATMETGLDNWLRSMMAQHPEHAELASMPQSSYKAITPLQSSSTFRVGHRKASPSLARFTSLATGVGGNGERKVSGIGEEAAETSSPGGAVGAELQQRSKELLKNAGVLGGKAQAGAKGLFAKGKSRFGRKDGDAKV